MAIEDDDKPRKKITHEIGQDLSLLSVEELTERIAADECRNRAVATGRRQKSARQRMRQQFLSSRRVVGFESNSFRRPCERRDPYRVIYR